ncbi:hypothetical protein MHH85_11020 [Viridibacillus sp. FSL E2-0187]|uniref:hypothetical protein n=1 Tax=Viridibacillus sp. FSL E2-0187 TaxID=2921362 RepID=UPI0030F9DDF5
MVLEVKYHIIGGKLNEYNYISVEVDEDVNPDEIEGIREIQSAISRQINIPWNKIKIV